MKKLLFKINILFLIVGSPLLSSIHHMHEHSDDLIEHHECQECLSLENNNSYTIESNDYIFLNYGGIIPAFQYLSFIIFDIDSRKNSRAPPISK